MRGRQQLASVPRQLVLLSEQTSRGTCANRLPHRDEAGPRRLRPSSDSTVRADLGLDVIAGSLRLLGSLYLHEATKVRFISVLPPELFPSTSPFLATIV